MLSVKMCINNRSNTHKIMQTNIVIDDQLMKDALKVTGLKTKKETVELGLKTLIKLKKQEGIKKFRGRLKWEGNLDDMRNNQYISGYECLDRIL